MLWNQLILVHVFHSCFRSSASTVICNVYWVWIHRRFANRRLTISSRDLDTHKHNITISKKVYLTEKIRLQFDTHHWWTTKQSLATTTTDLKNCDALPINPVTSKNHQFHPIKRGQPESLPSRCGCTSRATTTRQARTIGASIVATARNVELDLTGDTRIPDRLHRAASQSEAYSRRHIETLALRASTICSSKAGDSGRHCQRGGSDESSGDEENVELHYGEMV